MSALAKADADVAADPAAAMAAVSKSMSGAISTDDLATMWQDVDIGLKLDTELAELLVAEADWILEQGVIKGDPVSLETMLTKFSGDALASAAPDAVSLP